MTISSLAVKHSASFQFKTSFAPCTILQIARYDLDVLQQELADIISRAPNFFLGAPIVIDLEKVKNCGEINFVKLKEILIAKNLVPIGVRNGSPEQLEWAATYGLPALSMGKLIQTETSKKVEKNPSKLITTPIRSGMQVYAKDADLIVVAPVSAGAELLADGHIHIYGRLRGRALAGVQGDMKARIFCHALEAELISIAGFYLTKEDMQPPSESHGMIQIYLDNEQVRIEKVS
ncbi:MAG TPA: septum site-determining protein MinC [Gammaproteobacteria bacterium]|nr:septum site-determining protein MinC [Gammaproteobacteria bacterium]